MNTLKTSSILALCLLAPACAAAVTCSKSNPELFVDFLPKFSESKAFAVQRTELPLPLLLWGNDANTDGQTSQQAKKVYLSAAEYGKWPSLSRYMQDKDLQPHVQRQTKTDAVIDVQKEGSDGLVSFHFKVKAGCWYLWQYELH